MLAAGEWPREEADVGIGTRGGDGRGRAARGPARPLGGAGPAAGRARGGGARPAPPGHHGRRGRGLPPGARLAGAITDDELETFLEQQVATEQAEFVAEFFWALHAKGCEAPGRMAEWIDSHNALVGRLLGQLDRRNAPLGPRHKRRLWRLKAARLRAQ